MTGTSSNDRIWIYLLVSAGLGLVAVFSYHFIYRIPFWTLHAFSVPSNSLCPTICAGERVLVQMQDGEPYVSQRGDVIVFAYGAERTNYIKRVIGVPGDIVAPGPAHTILVNGNPWVPPPVCAKSLLPTETARDSSQADAFASTRVPADQLFVIGDNLNNSFDSRIDSFGAVTADRVIGKPVMIYWSGDSSRVGCRVR